MFRRCTLNVSIIDFAKREREMRTRYTQMEILMCLFDCKRHTISELQSKTGYSGYLKKYQISKVDFIRDSYLRLLEETKNNKGG